MHRLMNHLNTEQGSILATEEDENPKQNINKTSLNWIWHQKN